MVLRYKYGDNQPGVVTSVKERYWLQVVYLIEVSITRFMEITVFRQK